MQPQDKNAAPDFDFMLKEPPLRKSSGLGKLGLPAKILIGAVMILVVVTLAAVVFSRGNGSGNAMLGLMAQGQEIIRVSQLEEQSFKDSGVQGLESTVVTVLQSQQQQMGAYLRRTGVKYSQKQLSSRIDKQTDVQLQAAVQNNNLDNAYSQYLKTSLAAYQNSLAAAYRDSQTKTLQDILSLSYESTDVLLKSPQFKS